MKKLQFILLVLFMIPWSNLTYSQICDSCICGTTSFSGETSSPGTFFGGRYKPHRSDIGGAPSNQDRFPILIVFVSFKDEPGDSITTNFDSWPARKPPNYLDSLIDTTRRTNTNWWDAYNGLQIADYWHEFSRGKMHVTGRALHIKLNETISWYETNGMSKLNKDIYDSLINRIDNWGFYDRWTYNSEGNFTWDPDNLVDMIYIVYRQWRQFLFDGNNAWGLAFLGPCQGSNANYEYTVSTSPLVKIKSVGDSHPLGSGVKLHAGDTSRYSRQRFIDIVTHEHGHYLFEFSHKVYMKMSYRSYYDWEFSLSPWEVIKLNYIIPKTVNYSNTQYSLSDYSSQYGSAGDTGEVLQVPISSDGTEFFLIANRRKVSQWDRRVGGDTLANDRWQFLKPINEEYGKGLYIYHVKDGYEFDKNEAYGNDIDLECADGLWNYIYAGVSRKRINTMQPANVYKKQYPSYNNDSPESNVAYTSGRDDMSYGLIFEPGKADDFSTSDITRGIHSIYTNEEDYWYSLASNGDRWDAWNLGYNVIFSPYSSPNTNNKDNQPTGLFVWYKSLSGNTATLKILKAYEYGEGTPLTTILQETPPSRPMGLRVLSCDSTPTISGFQRIRIRWFHNMEPDMDLNGNKKYKIYCDTAVNLSTVPLDAIQYSQNYYRHIATVNIASSSIPEYIDSFKISTCYNGGANYTRYPVRYRVQAVDKFDSVSVLSDFAKTKAWTSINGGQGSDNLPSNEVNNVPKEYSLKQNYPNPFNPATNIQYDLPIDNFVKLTVYNILGKEVNTLVNEFKKAGSYIISFSGAELPSGIYYYKIQSGSFVQIRKMILIK